MRHLLNWVEIPVSDMERAVNFYRTIYGGKLDFHRMELSGTEYAIFPSANQFNSGALVKGEYYKPSRDGITIYLDGGDDLNSILQYVANAGGMVVMEKTYLSPEAGFAAMFIDSEGNKIGLQNS